MAYSSLRIDANTLNLLKEIKARMEIEYVRPLSFDFVLKKIIEIWRENNNIKLNLYLKLYVGSTAAEV